jgi:hypothetical protein
MWMLLVFVWAFTIGVTAGSVLRGTIEGNPETPGEEFVMYIAYGVCALTSVILFALGIAAAFAK